jgi:antibiotic biosynthesis monooxygenase (ABM) superfamily enzyme
VVLGLPHRVVCSAKRIYKLLLQTHCSASLLHYCVVPV